MRIPFKLTIKKFDNIHSTQRFIERKPGSPPFDAVIFLKDLENTNLNNQECSNFKAYENASGKKADKSFWFVFYNYPSIEYWYILHFDQCSRGGNNADAAEKELKLYYSQSMS